MNPRFVKIQDVKTRQWHYINVHHVVSVSETIVPKTAPHWDPGTQGEAYATVRLIDGAHYETDTFSVEILVQRITKENNEWSRVIDKLDLLSP